MADRQERDDVALSDLLNSKAAPSTPLTVIEDSGGKPKPKRKPHPMRGLGQYGGYIAVAVVAALVTGAVVIYLTPVHEVSDPVAPTVPPPFPMTPTFPYNDQFNNGRYDFVLNEASGSIPANSRVQLVGGWYDPETNEVWYSIQAQSDFATANARFRQLQYSPDPSVTVMPTTTMAFSGEIGSSFFMVTTEQVGAIPAGTRVRISHAMMRTSGQWVYVIVAQDETTIAEAFEWQLTYAPGVTPGMTPTARFNDAAVTGQYNMITREQIGSIPAGSPVIAGSMYLGADEWVYNISADGQNYVEARESQLDFAPDYVPGTPAPTPTMIPF